MTFIWNLDLLVTQPAAPEDYAEGLVPHRPFRYEVLDHEVAGVRWTFNGLDQALGWLRGLLLQRHAGFFAPAGWPPHVVLPADTGRAACGWFSGGVACIGDDEHGHDETGALVYASDLAHAGYVPPQRNIKQLRDGLDKALYLLTEARGIGDWDEMARQARFATAFSAKLALLERMGG